METTTNQTYLAERQAALSHANSTNSSTGSTSSGGGTSGTQAGVSKSGAESSYAAFSVLGVAVAAGLALFI